MQRVFFKAVILFLSLTPLKSISFKAPKLTGEERASILTPSNLQCDACIAVSFQIEKAIFLAERSHNTNKIDISLLYETLETVCNSNRFDNYGIKAIDGINRLSGEGLAASEVAGMLSGGGKWPGRLLDKCGQVIGEVGEENVYAAYKRAHNIANKKGFEFATELCIREETKDCISEEVLQKLIAKPNIDGKTKKKTKNKKTKKRKKKIKKKRTEL
jgi:hypothetical protein